jgi:hypothetical protein
MVRILGLVWIFAVGCAEPAWDDGSVYVIMKAAAGPATVARSVVPMAEACSDAGQGEYQNGVTACEMPDDENPTFDGMLRWETDYEGRDPMLLTEFLDVTWGAGEHTGRLSGDLALPLRDGGSFTIDDLRLSMHGDPFEAWTDEENEFLVTVEAQDFRYTKWEATWSESAAWTTGGGSVEMADGRSLKVGIWTETGRACFGTLPPSRIEVEEDVLDLLIEPTDWRSCTGCWTWHDDAGDSGELCLIDLL